MLTDRGAGAGGLTANVRQIDTSVYSVCVWYGNQPHSLSVEWLDDILSQWKNSHV